jgi:hypothetical protein
MTFETNGKQMSQQLAVRVPVLWRRLIDDSRRHPLLVFKDQPNMGVVDNIISKYSEDKIVKDNKSRLDAVRSNDQSSGGLARVELHQKKVEFPGGYQGCEFIGRSFGQSLTHMPTKIVNTIYHDTHACIDMVNSHFEILMNLFGHLDVPHIRAYGTNRDGVIQGFQRLGFSGVEVKRGFLSLVGACPKMPSDFGSLRDQPDKIRVFGGHPLVLGVMADLVKCYDAIKQDYPLFAAAMVKTAANGGRSDYYMGVTLSHLCQDVEDAAMRNAVKTLQNGHDDNLSSSIIWKFDGAILPKTMVYDGEDALRRVQASILEEYGLHLRFSFKPMDVDIFPECASGYQVDPYKRFKEGFEKTRFKCLFPLSYCRIKPSGGVEMLSQEKWNVLNAEHSKELVAQWEADPDKRRYERVDTIPPPAEVPYGVYNLYGGFAAAKNAEPMEPEEIERRNLMWENHVDIMMGHDEDAKRWFHDLMAHMLQKPGVKTGKNIFIRSIQGTGKDQMANFLGSIMGPGLFCKVDTMDDLTGPWNGAFAGKVLCVVSECNYKDFDSKNVKKLKAITTRESFLVKQKYQPEYIASCTLNLMIFTNDYGGMNMNALERRYVCAQADGRYAQDDAYHVPFNAYIQDKANQVAVFRKYMQRDITQFNPHRQYISKIQKEMSNQASQSSPMVAFFKNGLQRWVEYADHNGNPNFVRIADDTIEIYSTGLFEEYDAFLEEMKWPMAEKSQASKTQILTKGLSETGSQASKFAPQGMIPINKKRKRRPGMNPMAAYQIHIPSIQKWLNAMMCEDDEEVESEGPLPTAFARANAFHAGIRN